MLYEEYQAKLEKEQSKRARLFHFRFLILFSLLTIIAIVLSLLATKGIVTASKIAAKTYTYGETISYSGKAFMSDCQYEFTAQDQNNWSEDIPSRPGNYLLRPKAKNGFGNTYYGQEQSFTILPKDLNISFVTTENIPYGEKAEITADGLTYTDKVANYEVDYDVTSSPVASVPLESVQIQNTKGEDVTDCYHITVPSKEEITFKKRDITLSFKKTSKTYDGKAFEKSDFRYDIIGGSLATGDSITLKDYPTETNVNENIPIPSIQITNKEGIDVTKYYSLKTSTKKFAITKKKIIIKGKDYSRPYDGTKDIYNDGDSKPVEKIEVSYDSSLLIGNDKIEITQEVSNISPRVGTYSLPFTAVAKNSNGEDVTSNYDLDINPGKFEIKARDITIYAGCNEKIDYRGTLSDDDLKVLTKNDLCHADNLASTDELYLSAQYDQGTTIKYDYQILNKETKEDVTTNYKVTTSFIPVEATKRDLSVQTEDLTVTYDGQPHTLSNLEYDSSKLYPGDKIVKAEAPTYTDANSNSNPNYSFAIPFTIKDSDGTGKDVTSYYNITTIPGELVIKPRPISITLLADGTAEEYSKTYDGQAIDFTLSDTSKDDFPLTPSKASSDYGLLTSLGDKIQANAFPENVYKIGNATYNNPASVNQISYSVKIIRNDSIDVSSNYAITYKRLHTEIKKRPIALDFGSITRYYDGDSFPTAHFKAAEDDTKEADDYSVTIKGEGLARGDTIQFEGIDGNLYSGVSELTSGKQSSVSYDLSNLDTSKIKILHGEEDVSDCYDIQSVTGTIQIKRAKLTLAPSEDDFPYDGTEHSIHYAIQESSSDYPSDYTFHSSSITAKKPGNYPLSDTVSLSKGRSVIDASEMDITYTSSSVNVTKRKATIHIPSYIYYWTGEPLALSTIEDSATADNLVAGDHFQILQTSVPYQKIGTYSFTDTLSYQILDSSGNDVSDCYDIKEDFGTLSIIKMTLVYQGSADKEVTYDGNLSFYSESDFTFVKEKSIAPDDIAPTISIKESFLDDYHLEASIDKVTAEYNSFTYSYSSELTTNTIDIVLETKPKVTIKKRDAVIDKEDFTHYQNKKAISTQEVANHLSSDNLADNDYLVIASKTDENGKILDAPSTEGTYTLTDYFTIRIYNKNSGNDRTKYYRFIDSFDVDVPTEVPTEQLDLGKVTIKKVSVHVSFAKKEGGYSSRTAINPWSDYCTITFPNGENLPLDVALSFTGFEDGTPLPGPGDYTYYIKSIRYQDPYGGFNDLTKEDFDIQYQDGETGNFTLRKEELTLDITLPTKGESEEPYFGQGISAIKKDLFALQVTGCDDISIEIVNNLAGDYVSVGEHQLTGDDFTFKATDTNTGEEVNLATFFSITIHAPKYKVIPLTLSLNTVSKRRAYNGTFDTTMTITSSGKLLFYDNEEEVSSKLVEAPTIRTIIATFTFAGQETRATPSDITLLVIDSLEEVSGYQLSNGTLQIQGNDKDNVTMTIAKKQASIKFRNIATTCDKSVSYHLSEDNFVVTGLAQEDKFVLDSSPSFSYVEDGKSGNDILTKYVEESEITFHIENSKGVDVTSYYDISYQRGTLTILFTESSKDDDPSTDSPDIGDYDGP